MSEKLIFDYYYGKEADQFTFYRIPKMLIKDKRFSGLSSDAKILYGLMLDRMSLSIMNEWQDNEDRTYIIYTIDQISEDLGCGRDKAMKTLAELDAGKGIGLIEKVRRGLGLADIIYVKNFVGIERIQDENEIENKEKNDEKESANPHKSTEVGNVDFKKSEKSTSRGRKCRLQEVGKADFKKSEKQTSRSRENRLQEVDKTDIKDNNTSYNDSNYNNLRETNHIISNPEGRSVKNVNNMQINSQKLMDEMVVTTWLIKDNISYDALVATHPVDKKRIDEMIEIMVDVIVSNSDTVRIGKEDKPREIVRSRFEKLDFSSMEYILGCLKENTTKVHNIKNYLLTTLYNASLTIDNYYSAEVNHDLYGCE